MVFLLPINLHKAQWYDLKTLKPLLIGGWMNAFIHTFFSVYANILQSINLIILKSLNFHTFNHLIIFFFICFLYI